MPNRRQLLIASAVAFLGITLHRRSIAQSESLRDRIHQSLSRAIKFLADRQQQDGAWRSEIYGPFKDGPSLTSLIAATLTSLPKNSNVVSTTSKAAKYLAAQISPGAGGFTYPTYTAAGAVITLVSQPEFSKAQTDWLNYLRSLQLSEDLGWRSSDLAYGGWSYAATGLQPLNGAPATPLAVPNLSATVFALEALRAAGLEPCDPAIKRATLFVERCQNWSDDPSDRDEPFNDGGFHFALEDAQRNKAGELGVDGSGRHRFASYGSATADGLRALAYCGYSNAHPRPAAAESWLSSHFSAEKHPGSYQSDREHLRPTLYYYYASSIAQAFCLSSRLSFHANDLATALLSRQRPDGSWINPAVDVREDDPLVATPLAIRALYGCVHA